MLVKIFWLCAFAAVAPLYTPAHSQTCDLSRLDLPELASTLALGAQAVAVRTAGRLDFERAQGGIFRITETVYSTVDRGKRTIARLIRDEIGPLPNDECGLMVSLSDPKVGASDGKLTIELPVTAGQWGCLIGVRGQIAGGKMTFRATFTPTVEHSKLILTPALTNTGNLRSTVPNVDPNLTRSIDSAIRTATNEAVGRIQGALKKLQERLHAIQADIQDPTESIRPIYRPTVGSIGFSVDGDALTLTQIRNAEARSGTSCAIRRRAVEFWTSAGAR